MKRRNRDGTAEWFTIFFDAAYVAQLREEKPPAQTRREVDFLLRALRPAPGARILDVPCGYGRHAAALARRGFRVVGVDLSRAMIAEARRRFAERPRLTFVRGDMRRRPFRAAGLRFRHAYSGYDGRRYRAGATGRLIVVAERPLRLDRVRPAS